GRRIAVRNKRGLQAMAARHLEHVERPLGGDERLVVGRPDELRSLSQREPNQVVRGDVGRDYAGGVVAQRLAREPVLAIPTVEIASQHTEGERVGAGEGVEERLLLGRIALQGGDVAGAAVRTSRGESSRTLGWAYMMSPGSGEWSRPIRCPISCRASTRTSSGANGCPLASKVARVTTPPVRRPSSSHCTSVCPERSPSN